MIIELSLFFKINQNMKIYTQRHKWVVKKFFSINSRSMKEGLSIFRRNMGLIYLWLVVLWWVWFLSFAESPAGKHHQKKYLEHYLDYEDSVSKDMRNHWNRLVEHNHKCPYVSSYEDNSDQDQNVEHTVECCSVPIGSDEHVWEERVRRVNIWSFDRPKHWDCE